MTKERKKICLKNRYGDKLYLELIKDKTYKLVGELDYLSVTYGDGFIIAIDPPGGPYLCIGKKVASMIIDKIICNIDESRWEIKFK